MCCGFDCCRGKAESAEPAEIDMLTVAMRSKNCTLLAAVLAILCIITVYIYIYKLYIYIYIHIVMLYYSIIIRYDSYDYLFLWIQTSKPFKTSFALDSGGLGT